MELQKVACPSRFYEMEEILKVNAEASLHIGPEGARYSWIVWGAISDEICRQARLQVIAQQLINAIIYPHAK